MADWLLWLILIVANIPAYIGLGILFYGSWRDYADTVWQVWHSGGLEWRWPWERWEESWQLWRDHPREMLRLVLYIACCVLLVVGEFLLIRYLWPRPRPFPRFPVV